MKIDKCEKLAFKLYDKKIYVIHIRVLNQTLDHVLILKKFHRLIEFSQEAWQNSYIDMNTGFKTKAKNGFERKF